MSNGELMCGDCEHWVIAPPGAGLRRDTERVGNCTGPKPAWVTQPIPLVKWSDNMAEVCECYRRRSAGA